MGVTPGVLGKIGTVGSLGAVGGGLGYETVSLKKELMDLKQVQSEYELKPSTLQEVLDALKAKEEDRTANEGVISNVNAKVNKIDSIEDSMSKLVAQMGTFKKTYEDVMKVDSCIKDNSKQAKDCKKDWESLYAKMTTSS